MHKKISIIIPCYNVEPYIDRCLTSLLNQTIGIENLAIICVNDASTDNTWNKLEAWKKHFPNDITLINCTKNGRQGTARNIAFPYVTTPYVAYLDGDDWIEPDMYEKMYQKAHFYNCDIVFCGMIRDCGTTPAIRTKNSPSAWLLIVDSVQERKKLIIHNTIKYSCCDKLIHTDFLAHHQITFPEQLAYEDIYWGSMLYLYARAICIMEDPFYHYYINPASTVLSTDHPYHKDILQINQLRWQMYQARNAIELYCHELAYDFLISGYLLALKILALRYTTSTWKDYRTLCESTLAHIPDFTANPYYSLFTDFQKLQLQMLAEPLTPREWEEYCHFFKTHPNMK